MNNLGLLYLNGKGCIQSNLKAFECFEKAAEKQNLNGLIHLGDCYENGIGAKKDLQKVIVLYENAAKLGNSEALTKLGAIYYNENDYSKAAVYFRQADELENFKASYNLGVLYEKGQVSLKATKRQSSSSRSLLIKETETLHSNSAFFTRTESALIIR